MDALYLLIPLSIVIVFIAIAVFFMMSDSGQFEDMVGPALRILQDDDGGDVKRHYLRSHAGCVRAAMRFAHSTLCLHTVTPHPSLIAICSLVFEAGLF
jgi:cbb3-type cytochrome oxidase maturation protein